MHSLRKYQGSIIYQTWVDIEPFGTDKSVPDEALMNKITMKLMKADKHKIFFPKCANSNHGRNPWKISEILKIPENFRKKLCISVSM